MWPTYSILSRYPLLWLGCRFDVRRQTSLSEYTRLYTYYPNIQKRYRYPLHSEKMSFTTYLTATNPSIQEAVNTLTSTIATEASSDNLETALWKTWSEFLHLVADTPHATQQPLVDFLQALRKAPNPKKEDGELYELWGEPFKWQNLPLFGSEMAVIRAMNAFLFIHC